MTCSSGNTARRCETSSGSPQGVSSARGRREPGRLRREHEPELGDRLGLRAGMRTLASAASLLACARLASACATSACSAPRPAASARRPSRRPSPRGRPATDEESDEPSVPALRLVALSLQRPLALVPRPPREHGIGEHVVVDLDSAVDGPQDAALAERRQHRPRLSLAAPPRTRRDRRRRGRSSCPRRDEVVEQRAATSRWSGASACSASLEVRADDRLRTAELVERRAPQDAASLALALRVPEPLHDELEVRRLDAAGLPRCGGGRAGRARPSATRPTSTWSSTASTSSGSISIGARARARCTASSGPVIARRRGAAVEAVERQGSCRRRSGSAR